MNASKLFNLDELERHLQEGYVKATRHPTAPLTIYSYTPETQWSGAWNDVTNNCRGLILDGDFEIVARPFSKFHNYSDYIESEGILPDGPVHVTEKMDGSLGILYWIDGEPFIATRGSFTSEQAIWATCWFRNWWINSGEKKVYFEDATWLFEIIYPENRIVVDYKGNRELTLLAVINNATGEDLPLPSWYPWKVRTHFFDSLEDVLSAPERENAEGYVIRWQDGLRLKLKHEEYKRLHRILTGINARHIWEYLKEGKDLKEILDGVPDEFYRWVKGVEYDLSTQFSEIETACIKIFSERPLVDDRKEIAAYFLQHEHRAILFLMLDKKDYSEAIWKLLRPAHIVPFQEDES